MKAYASSYQYLPREYWKIIDIPDDLQVMPVPMAGSDTNLCYSESEKKWYVIARHINRPGEEVYQAVVECGKWLDCYYFMANPYYNNVPFIWGKPIQSDLVKCLYYMPIWESVPTGEINITEDGWESPVYKEVYKIIKLYLDQFPEMSENVYQSNQYSSFEIFEYGENLYKLVCDLQLFTNIIY